MPKVLPTIFTLLTVFLEHCQYSLPLPHNAKSLVTQDKTTKKQREGIRENKTAFQHAFAKAMEKADSMKDETLYLK